MKLDKLAVIITNKKGDCFQVGLTKEENEAVINFIVDLHGGKIKADKQKLPLSIKYFVDRKIKEKSS